MRRIAVFGVVVSLTLLVSFRASWACCECADCPAGTPVTCFSSDICDACFDTFGCHIAKLSIDPSACGVGDFSDCQVIDPFSHAVAPALSPSNNVTVGLLLFGSGVWLTRRRARHC